MSLYIPTFNGETIFGLDVTMAYSDPARDVQLNKFLGINGVEAIDYGMGHAQTSVSGRLYGESPAALVEAEALMRSYKNPFAYILVDTAGVTWEFVKLHTVEMIPRMMIDARTGAAWRHYRAVLIHLRPG